MSETTIFVTGDQLAEWDRLAAAASPAAELSMRLDQWIERRTAEEKYSSAEFEHEADRDFYFAATTAVPALIAEVRRLREALKPFAEYGSCLGLDPDGKYDDDQLNSDLDGRCPTFGHCRRAAEALRRADGQ
jgi:hypothetical protein